MPSSDQNKKCTMNDFSRCVFIDTLFQTIQWVTSNLNSATHTCAKYGIPPSFLRDKHVQWVFCCFWFLSVLCSCMCFQAMNLSSLPLFPHHSWPAKSCHESYRVRQIWKRRYWVVGVFHCWCFCFCCCKLLLLSFPFSALYTWSKRVPNFTHSTKLF